ncbi:FecCD family ABC transporter permease [Paenibacillus crassostreae]|uniref:Iron ABC transporter permease n=1 Tax=Paenibacillus crassostreae TaxID=1763538 RepID=A0A167G2R2_9BACL|nr:iron ABC transporter permease [Paenibacillus crassostreae]AOZ93819.1 iron ABC transporter permease [Paenibacillus crassostreae]OAB77148.1 iron ABC transporter permease [Paenibacillus crassostreae]
MKLNKLNRPEKVKKKSYKITLILIFAFLIFITFIISMNTGVSTLTPMEVLNTILGQGTDFQNLILFEFRLPRIIISILVGAGLAVSGCILQGVTRNPLADPGLLGITIGAGLAVVLFVSFFPSNTPAPTLLLPFLALLGASLTGMVIYLLAYSKQDGLIPIRLILVGIAVSAGLGAILTVLSLRLNHNDYDMIAVWLVGRIWGSSWDFVLALIPWLVILLPYAFYKARILDAFGFGDKVATGFGISVEKERMKLLGIAIALAASCVSVSGGIAFVGLIGPHLARRLIGPQHKYLLPASALIGALMLILADTLGRAILQPTEIPAGIVVALIGAPYFLYMLAREV